MGHDREMGHVQSMGTYAGVFISLVILTGITVGVAIYAHSESELVNLAVAVVVATVKVSLVVLFFMHGKYEGKVTWAFIYYPLILLGLLLGGVFLDYMNRGENTQFSVVAKSVYSADGHHGEDHGAGGHGGDGHSDDGHSHDGDAAGTDGHGGDDHAKDDHAADGEAKDDHAKDDHAEDDHSDDGHN